MSTANLRNPQNGAALVVGLIILLLVSLIGMASIRSNTLELRMASNLEARNASFEQAQAALDYLVANPNLIPVVGQAGYTICTANLSGCNQNDIDLPYPLNDGANGPNTLLVVRDNPTTGLPPRLLATSSSFFVAAYFRARSAHDDSAASGGRTALGMGFIRIFRK